MSTTSTVTPQLEKLFLHWIFKNSQFFKSVEGNFFKNEDLKFVYNAARNEFLFSQDKQCPSIKEIKTMVRSLDPDEKISTDLLNAILKNDFTDYRDEFIETRFKAWVLSNSTIAGLVESIEKIKNIDRVDYTAVNEAVDLIKNVINEKTTIDLGDSSIGIDFDDPDAHNQETFANKLPTGWEAFDTMLGGGIDRKTLTVYMGMVGGGKSITLQNFCVNFADAGFNVLYVTLELSEKKALKRMGSMRLNIDINQYDVLSKDREFMKEKIDEANGKCTAGLFERQPGKIWIKEFPSGSATCTDIENVVKLIYETTGKRVDALIVDYIQIMKVDPHYKVENMLYLKGKYLAEGLRAIGQRHNLAVMTATQISKEKYNANDLELNDLPESKAIADTADSVIGIIRTPQMKIEGRYHWKRLKLRDSESEYDRIGFDFNKKTLKIYNGEFIENVL